ncbi:MAG TPA: ribonuclease E/G, partial [Myxococcales bacterium]
MSNILVINASGQETRVALIEQGTISEYYLERKNEKGIVGNIYKGRVVRVLPGMQAAFVDIGLEKAAFLYVGDIVADPTFPGFSEEMDIQASAALGDPLDAEDLPEPSEDGASAEHDHGLDEHSEPSHDSSADDHPPHELTSTSAGQEASAAPSESFEQARGEEHAGPAQVAQGEPQAEAAQETSSVREQGVFANRSAEGTFAEGSPFRADSSRGDDSQTASATHVEPPGERAPEASVAMAVGLESGAAVSEASPVIDPAPVAPTPSDAEVVELSADDALEDEDDDEDDDEEELDEADAAHAAAEEQIAAESAGEGSSDAGPAQEGTKLPEAGARGVPAEQRPAAREGRRGRRRGGRGRRRGNAEGPRPAGEHHAKPPTRNERSGTNGNGHDQRRGQGNGSEKRGNGHKRQQIQDLLKEGDEVLVQVVKDPIGTKGARITCHISLPGRHLVFMPTVDHVGISRRIENEKERRRLRELVDKYRPAGTGFIVRTVAENEPSEKLTADIKFLLGLWNEVGKKRESMKAPACVHPDLDLILRSIRDLFSDEVEKLVIDDRAEYERVVSFVEQVAPELKNQVELYGGEEPIFDEYGIEQELIRASNRKVWLKSGGYIIIDQTEALVAIDVNSGRYVGKKGAGASLEDTITKINCEAAK